MAWRTWREAAEHALYGPGGFYRREQPAGHFRTSVHVSTLFAGAVAQLAEACRARTVVDVGAGRGELLVALRQHGIGSTLVGVDVSPRPPGLPTDVQWTAQLPDQLTDVLVIANEWLDDVPVDVVEVDAAGHARLVLVDPASGAEQLGGEPDAADVEWLARWWPLDGAAPSRRAEIGRPRDEAWADVVRRVHDGVVVAVDYYHLRADRPPFGSLTGYRDGRTVPPIPNGSCNITAHVALDACEAAGAAAGVRASLLTTQRQALRALGVDALLPPREFAVSRPREYLDAVARASQATELLDPSGLGRFGWLVQTVGRPLPAPLAAFLPPTRSP
ncbi:MAG: SAM-dependent methyltransferase [Jiangellaceae bacterium]|nr:SAM-dependent methyltransferase [Jiangellaceae bacterium]